MSVGELDGIDVLLPVAEWPGFRWTYDLCRSGSDGGVSLIVTAAFSVGPLLLTDGGVDAAVATLVEVSDQLHDPRLDLELLSTLAASRGSGPQDWGVVAESEHLREPLQALVAAASEQLQALAAGGGAALAPVLTKSITAFLPLESLAARTEDVIPVAVYLRLLRRSKAVPGVPGLPAPTSAISVIGPDLGDDVADPLARFAARCESVLADYEGAKGALKLAASGSADGLATTPELWAVRWGGEAGICVTRSEETTASAVGVSAAPSYFVPFPLSNRLLSGTVDVPVYGADLEAVERSRSYVGISLASWVTRSLQLVDELVGSKWRASDNSTAVGHLLRHRTALADALVAGLSSLSPDQPTAVAGGLASARSWLREAMVSSLTVAMDLEAVVSVPMVLTRSPKSPGAMTVRGVVEAGGDSAPEGSTPAGTLAGYVASEAQVSLVPDEQPLLSFGLATGSAVGNRELSLRYRISHLHHRVDGAMTWLEFLVGGPGSVLDVDLGSISTSQPSQAFPEPPRPRGHAAVAQLDAGADTPVADALRWKYVARLETSTDPRDQLWVDTSYGAPGDTVGAVPSAQADAAKPAVELFSALARLLSASESLGANVANFPDAVLAADASPRLAAAVRARVGLVGDLAAAWSARTEQLTPHAGGPGLEPSPRFVLSFAPVNVEDEAGNGTAGATWRMFGRGSDAAAPRFPALAVGDTRAVLPTGVGQAGSAVDGTGSWWQADYACGRLSAGDLTELTFTWENLEILAAQSAMMTSRTVRNTEFGAPEFVFTSGTAGFGSPAEPHLVIPLIGPLPWRGSMFDSIWPVFEPIAASAPAATRVLQLQVEYERQLDPLAGDAPATGRLPVILVPQVEIPGGDAEAMRTFVTAVAAALSEWQSAQLPSSSTPGSMLLRLAISGDRTPHPLATFEQISVLVQ